MRYMGVPGLREKKASSGAFFEQVVSVRHQPR